MDDTALQGMLGARMRAAREKLHLPQADVANEAGLEPRLYAAMERGEFMPSVPILCGLARALRSSTDALLGLGSGEEVLPEETRAVLQQISLWPPEKVKVLAQVLKVLEGSSG